MASTATPPDDAQARFDAPQRTRPGAWNVPVERSPSFFGRDDFLEALRDGFAAGERAIAIPGLDGTGKTAAAVEFAHRHSAEYDVVWWVRAAEPATRAFDLASLAYELGLASRGDRDLPGAAERARRWLETSDRWLLVFDDAAGPESIRAHVPEGVTGHVLVTSVNPLWGTVARVHGLGRWTPSDAVEFLLERSGGQDREAAGEVAELLEHLPMALEQAGAYVRGTGSSLGDYARLLRARSTRSRAGAPPGHRAVEATWSLSLSVIEARSPAAGDLLRLCAFFAPEAIPLGMIHAAPHLFEPLRSAVADVLDLDRTIRFLQRYSLVTRSPGGIGVHPLVQLAARGRMDQAEARRLAALATAVVDASFPDTGDPLSWTRTESLVPHALAAARWARTADPEPWRTARLLDHLGRHLRGSGRYPEARAALQEALRLAEDAHGHQDAAVATVADDLAAVLRHLGELEGARDLIQRALRIDEAWFGPDHLRVVRDVDQLATALFDLGDLEGARDAFRRSLELDERAYGKEHARVGVAWNNLASVLLALGDLRAARDACERALRIHEAAYGRVHPEVARDSANLASVLLALGDLEGARQASERALRIDEAYGQGRTLPAPQATRMGDEARA